jgi:hypothetical protein
VVDPDVRWWGPQVVSRCVPFANKRMQKPTFRMGPEARDLKQRYVPHARVLGMMMTMVMKMMVIMMR